MTVAFALHNSNLFIFLIKLFVLLTSNIIQISLSLNLKSSIRFRIFAPIDGKLKMV